MGNDRSSYVGAQIIRNMLVLTASLGVGLTDDAKNFAVRRYFPRDGMKSPFRNRGNPANYRGAHRGSAVRLLRFR
jgi:hypothetical protein